MTAKYHGNFKARVCCQGGTAGNLRKSNGWQKPFNYAFTDYLMSPGSLGQFSSPSHRWTAHIRWEEPSQVICSALEIICGKNRPWTEVYKGKILITVHFDKEKRISGSLHQNHVDKENCKLLITTPNSARWIVPSAILLSDLKMKTSGAWYVLRIIVWHETETPSQAMKDFRSGK